MNEFDRTLLRLAILNEMEPSLPNVSKAPEFPKTSEVPTVQVPNTTKKLDGMHKMIYGRYYSCKTFGDTVWMLEDLCVNELPWKLEKESICTDNGWYYSWNDAKKLSDYNLNWKLPTREDWRKLITQLDGYEVRTYSADTEANFISFEMASELNLTDTGFYQDGEWYCPMLSCHWLRDNDCGYRIYYDKSDGIWTCSGDPNRTSRRVRLVKYL